MTTFSNATVRFTGYAETISPIQNLAALRRIISSTIGNGAHVILDGAVLPGDGAGGIYFWLYGSTAADDNSSTIRPDDLGPTEPGRWVLIALAGVTGQAITLTEVAASTVPNPTGGRQAIFIDSTDHKLKRKNELGTIVTIG